MRALEDLHFRSRVRDSESVDKAVEVQIFSFFI